MPSFFVSAVTLKVATIALDGTPWMEAMREGAWEITHRTQNGEGLEARRPDFHDGREAVVVLRGVVTI